MVLIDSSVWIDHFNNVQTPQTDWLWEHMKTAEFLVGDLILAEVLQGCSSNLDFDQVLRVFSLERQIDISTREIAVLAAQNYRRLRSMGITIRKTIDTLIATRCIVDRIPLLFSDRDFDPFVAHLGLIDAMAVS